MVRILGGWVDRSRLGFEVASPNAYPGQIDPFGYMRVLCGLRAQNLGFW
jgi:hypothetical protein